MKLGPFEYYNEVETPDGGVIGLRAGEYWEDGQIFQDEGETVEELVTVEDPDLGGPGAAVDDPLPADGPDTEIDPPADDNA